jgi:hypothetical protein
MWSVKHLRLEGAKVCVGGHGGWGRGWVGTGRKRHKWERPHEKEISTSWRERPQPSHISLQVLASQSKLVRRKARVNKSPLGHDILS